MKIECPVCGGRVGCYVPKGSDGSAVRMTNHYNREYRLTTMKIKCSGSKLLVDEYAAIREGEK